MVWEHIIYDSWTCLLDALMIKRQSLQEQVRDEILARIASGRLVPGDRIVIARLATEAGVSDVPVREAIHELVSAGVLESTLHKGASVRRLSAAEILAALEVRAAVEAIAARSAASTLKGNAADLIELAGATVEVASEGDAKLFQRHNREFHEALVEAGGMPILLRIWHSLLMVINTLGPADFAEDRGLARGAQEHESIARAVDQGDGDRAASLVERHFRGFMDVLERRP